VYVPALLPTFYCERPHTNCSIAVEVPHAEHTTGNPPSITRYSIAHTAAQLTFVTIHSLRLIADWSLTAYSRLLPFQVGWRTNHTLCTSTLLILRQITRPDNIKHSWLTQPHTQIYIYIQSLIHTWRHVSVLANHLQANTKYMDIAHLVYHSY
jgi:hypothetical protein